MCAYVNLDVGTRSTPHGLPEQDENLSDAERQTSERQTSVFPRILVTTKTRLDVQPFHKNWRIILGVSVSKSARDSRLGSLGVGH